MKRKCIACRKSAHGSSPRCLVCQNKRKRFLQRKHTITENITTKSTDTVFNFDEYTNQCQATEMINQ